MKKDNKLYLASLEFISGMYGQNFYKFFYAKDDVDFENKLHHYLNEYYGDGNTSEVQDGVYYYCNGEVGVKLLGYEKIMNLKQVVHRIT